MSYNTDMSYQNIIKELGGYRKLADSIGENPEKVRKWSERNSIPSEYWMVVSNKSNHQVTLNQLAEMAGT